MLAEYLYSYLNFTSRENYPLRSANAYKVRSNDIRNAKSIIIFKKLVLSKKYGNSLLFMYDPLGEKLLTRLRLNFSHLKEHKFRHGYDGTINPVCACGAEVGTAEHFLLRCHFYSIQRSKLFDNLVKANSGFKNLSDKGQVSFMLCSSKANTSESFNQNIIKIVIEGALSGLKQVLATERPLKTMKNAFYFTLKALFVLKIIFVLTFWSCIKAT